MRSILLAALMVAILAQPSVAQTSSQTIGNYTFYSDGTSSQTIGNYTFYSDGTSSQTRTSCKKIGRELLCN